MHKVSQFYLVAAATAFLGMFAVAPASAAVIYDVDFNLDVTSGFYAGQTYTGTVSYSDEFLSGTGHEVLVPGPLNAGSPPFVAAGFLSLAFDYGGQTFTLSDDISYEPGVYPWIYFNNGTVIGLDYYGGDAFGNFVVGISHTELFVGPLANSQTIGSVSYASPVARVPKVSEPLPLLLLGVGGSILVLLRRRQWR